MQSRATQWINLGAALLAVGLSTFAALLGQDASVAPRVASLETGLALAEPISLPDGGRALRDATGTLIPLVDYRRVASGSLLADPVLLLLSSPDEIVAFSGRAALARDAYRYSGKPSVDATRQIERLLELKPDLVLVNSLGEHAWVQKLRDSGLVVYDLGPMWGVSTFLRSLSAIGWLTGRPESAADIAGHFMARLEAIAKHLPATARRGALYVNVQVTHIYGGTRGSSFHDVLSYAGLVDVAAKDHQGWPSYSPELLLSLDPELIVTHTGMRSALCDRGAFGRLRACGPDGGVIEVDAELLSDAGLGMLEAAELVHHAAYPVEGIR
jgi:ABC-type Fe3+-hydroxamate transport system substrate-binding protein